MALSALPMTHRKAIQRMGPLFVPWRDGGRLLDVGCGNGSYLARMRAHGWAVTGQEVDEGAAEVARRQHGIEVHTVPLAQIPEVGGQFDVVTSNHVIEHVVDLRAFLRGAVACLRPGGRLVVISPNARSLGHRWFGRDWHALDPPRHLALYSPKALTDVARTIPELTSIQVRSLPGTAANIYRRGSEVRRHGRFRSGLPELARVRAAARAFAVIEAVACLTGRFGEELALLGSRADGR